MLKKYMLTVAGGASLALSIAFLLPKPAAVEGATLSIISALSSYD